MDSPAYADLVLEWRSFFYIDFECHDYFLVLKVVNLLTLINLYNSH